MKRNKVATELERAVRTLTHAGFTDCGGEYWKPPLGKSPDIQLADAFYKVAEYLKRQAQQSAHVSEILCEMGGRICEKGIAERTAEGKSGD